MPPGYRLVETRPAGSRARGLVSSPESGRRIEARRFDLKPWTDILPLEQGQRGFLKMAHAPGATLKMMLTA